MYPYKDKKIIIIGAGPAGLSVSSVLMMAGVRHKILEAQKSSGGIVGDIQNELDDFIIGTYSDGKELKKKIDEFTQKHRPPIEYNCKVTKIDSTNKIVEFTQDNKHRTLDFDLLIIATGVRFNIDKRFKDATFKEDIYYRISYCLDDFANKTVAVIGGGDNATIAAIRLSPIAEKVYLINKNDFWKSRKDLIYKIENTDNIHILKNSILNNIIGGKNIDKISITDNITNQVFDKKIDKIVFKTGYLPNTEIVKNTLKLDKKGYIITGNNFETSTTDIYAVGDIASDTLKRIAVAMGKGVELGNYLINDLL